MGANRIAPLGTYPAAFYTALASGEAVMFTDDLPWTPLSAAKRFRLFIKAIRAQPAHPLHASAKARWSVLPTRAGLEVKRRTVGELPALGAVLIESALSRG